MYRVNEDYLKLPGSYLFSTIGKKSRAFKEAHPEADVISLGIGDVTQPRHVPCGNLPRVFP